MKFSIFIEKYETLLESKDPVQIPLGLKDIGVDADLISVADPSLVNYKAPLPFIQTDWTALTSDEFWTKNDSDVIMAYTWLGAQYTPILQKIKAAKKKIILKIDSDGHVGYPIHPVYLRIPFSEDKSIRRLTSHVWYNVPFKSFHRRATTAAQKRIQQIELCDAVIIESPNALANLNYFLTWWGRQDLIKKTYFVPNPVMPNFIIAKMQAKENLLLAYGRLGDFRQKNTGVLIDATLDFLKVHTGYKAVFFGSGKDTINGLLKNLPKSVTDRISVLGRFEWLEMNHVISRAKIYLIPSRWESFGIAAGEALCMGCSVVATPVESLHYLTMQGFSGSLSPTFDRVGFLSALMEDSSKWQRGYYNPQEIASYWRSHLDRKIVATKIEEIANTTK